MAKTSTKRSLSQVTIILLLVSIAVFLIPTIWQKDVVIDKEKLANEYYGTLVDIGKILFGFWLANIYLKRQQRDEFVRQFKLNWREQTQLLFAAFQELYSLPDNPNIDVEDLAERIRSSDLILIYLSETVARLPDLDNVGLADNKPFQYKKDLHNQVKELVTKLDCGEIIGMKPFDQNVLDSLDHVLTKLSC